MKSTWIVVAESARGRLFAIAGDGGQLLEVAGLTHPESRLHDTDLSSDVPGRSFDSRGQGRHGMEQATDPHEREARAFAAEVARHIDGGIHAGSLDSLVLVAPPKFLGQLRSQLSKAARDMVVGEIDKNLVESDNKTLERYVRALLR